MHVHSVCDPQIWKVEVLSWPWSLKISLITAASLSPLKMMCPQFRLAGFITSYIGSSIYNSSTDTSGNVCLLKSLVIY